MKPRQVAHLSATDAAYLAGLIDGEGSVSLTRLHRGQNRQLSLSISSTERSILDWVLATTGVGKITTKRTERPYHAPGFTYMVGNRQAIAVLQQVVPHMRSYKLGRARLVLADYIRLTPRNGKYYAGLRQARSEFERAFASINHRRRPGPGGDLAERPAPEI
jgi:hypothetical protein